MTLKESIADNKMGSYVKTMTEKYTQDMRDFEEYRIHPPGCLCFLCLWRKYKQTRRPGHPYDYLTFLVWDIIFEAERIILIESGVVKKTKWKGQEVLEYYSGLESMREYFAELRRIQPSLRKLVRDVIRNLPVFSPSTKQYLNDYAKKGMEKHFGLYLTRKRYQRPDFLKLLSELELKISYEWKNSQPTLSPENPPLNRKDFKLARKIIDFVKSRKSVSQRELLRRFSNKKKDDIDRLAYLLKIGGIRRIFKESGRRKLFFYESF